LLLNVQLGPFNPMEDFLFENIILYNLKGLEVCLSSNSRTKEINYR